MTRRIPAMGFCAWLLFPALAAAQGSPAPPPQLPPPPTVTSGESGGSGSRPMDLKKMYEDVEILRRLLNRDFLNRQLGQCSSCHGGQGVHGGQGGLGDSIAFSPDGRILAKSQAGEIRLWDARTGQLLAGHPPLPHRFTGAEGVYLRGVGVIYTITLPILPESVKQAPTKPVPPPLSDWERIRRQLAGEAVDQAKTPPRPQPTLTESILKTLGENGRHFGQLAADEKLTIVVTFRGNEGTRTSTGGMGGGGPRTGTPLFGGFPGTLGLNAQRAGSGAGLPAGLLVNPSTASGLNLPGGGPLNSVRDYELLGDLQMKQGRLEEAIKVYRTALETGGAATEQAPLYRKLAQALLQRGQDSEALQLLEKALAAQKVSARPPRPASPSKASPLPSQLIISVPKGAADHYARGAMTFDQFRQTTHVELRRFTE